MSQVQRGSLQTCPTVQQFAADARRRAREFVLLGTLLALAVGGCVAALASAVLPLVALAAVAILIAMWHRPKFGVLLLFWAAVSIEVDTSHFPRAVIQTKPFSVSVAHTVPFFRPIQETVRGSGISLTGAELCMVILFLICLLQSVYRRRSHLERGTFFPAFSLLVAWWIVAAAHGIATGGAAKLAFQEIRSPLYAIILYLLTYSLVTRASDLNVLSWMILIGAGLKGIQCLFLYFAAFHRDISWSASGLSILEHHEAFFMNGYFFYTILLFMTNGSKQQKRFALLLLPVVFVANALNCRRAATAATVLALLALLPVLYMVFRERRASILRLTLAGTVLISAYAGLFWNSQSAIAQPIRAIRSQFTPDWRDASSDAYRKLENKNIMYTIRQYPIFGYGFGKEFPRPYAMIDLRKIDPYLFLLPHNTILWVWMRLGLVGFLLFWFMNGQWTVRACRTAFRYQEDWIRRWSLFALVMIVVNLTIAYLDMGLQGPRINIYLGVVLGVLDRLPLMAKCSGRDGPDLAE